jgi:hypothetical protein
MQSLCKIPRPKDAAFYTFCWQVFDDTHGMWKLL